MGREVKRVAMDFDWPQGTTWKGFLNPHLRQCGTCGGDGSTPHGRYLEHVARVITLGGSYPNGHPFMGTKPPGVKWGELSGALSREPLPPFGHDSIDARSVATKIREAAGLPDGWGQCEACDGEGLDPAAREAYEAWTPTAPPAGDGWQMWETTSEGSPISPVFATPKDLARWLADSGASTFGSMTATYEQWLGMIRGPGWAMSAVSGGRGLVSGVEFAGRDPE